MATPGFATLHHVTERKLDKLEKHRQSFAANKAAILKNVDAAPDPRSKIEALLEGFKQYEIKAPETDLSLSNLELFVTQGKHDPSVSANLFKNWQAELQKELDITSTKHDYAALFGKLVIEWIKHPNPAATAPAFKDSETGSDMGESFDTVGRKEMHEQREQWESYAFSETKVDRQKIEDYLNDIFTTNTKKVKKTPLQILREELRDVMPFQSELHQPRAEEDQVSKYILDPQLLKENRFSVPKLKSCIRGVIKSDLFAGEKRESLVALENQPAVLKELVDVLNMDLDTLDTWAWDPSPVPLTMRRKLNGKYRVYMDEETHQAIMLHWIGKIWASNLKHAFTQFSRSPSWTQSTFQSMDREAKLRHEYFLPGSLKIQAVRESRRKIHRDQYFLTQLPENGLEDYQDYATEDQNDASQSAAKSHSATKQAMLRLITTEMLLNTKIYGEFVVLQSDFKWFGPALPHDTILAVLEFFGVTKKWLEFFKKFLASPVVFAQDGRDAEGRVRKSGIPMSHILSDALSEAVLFCLDFAINKRTKGSNIFRFHDDLWFWGQETTCVEAWSTMQDFTKVMGLSLNQEKTGTALITAKQEETRSLSSKLPRGDVKWGFLYLDARAGRWVIDRKQIDEHIVELKRQLAACRSIMAWVKAYNSYVNQFFSANFAHPANCLGQQHNDMIIETFVHIQKGLFADVGTASATEYLRAMLKERFGIDDIPDGFFYFPLELGGLGLQNPFINAFVTYKKSLKSPMNLITKAFESDEEEYERLKKRWENGEDRPEFHSIHALGRVDVSKMEGKEAFMSLEEYTRYPEETSRFVRNAHTFLMEKPAPESVQLSKEFISKLGEEDLSKGPYWNWVYTLYAGDLKKRFGGDGLQLGQQDLLPMGLVDVLKSEQVRWEG